MTDPRPAPPAGGAPHRPDRSGRRLVELSHVVRHGMVTYPGLPGPEIGEHLSRVASRQRYPPGTEFQIGRITLVANTGTYLDTPFHRFPDGADLAGVELARLVDIDGLMVDVSRAVRPGIGLDLLAGHQVAGRAVLIRTGWDRNWGTARYAAAGHPFLTAEAAAWLAEQRPAVVGIDSVNIDDIADLTRPAHTALLADGIPIIEHMRDLDQLPPTGFRFHAPPVAVAQMGTFPVRAYAILDHPARQS